MRRWIPWAALALSVWSTRAAAQTRAPDAQPDPDGEDAELYKQLSKPRGTYARLLLAASIGTGFRFNNPYRLERQLGETAESVSLIATYFDAGLGATFGDPDGLQHGAMAHLSVALEGVGQQAVSGSYLVLYRGPWPVMGYARTGTVLLTTPDPNAGWELAVGGAYFFTGALGVTAEVASDLFWGADVCPFETATGCEPEAAVIPILSMQLGLMIDYEVLP